VKAWLLCIGIALIGIGCAPTVDSPLPGNFRSCKVDADCVVAPSLAGLDHLPKADESCIGTCYIGVHRDHLKMWLQEVARRETGVLCNKEFEECPPKDHWVVRCGTFRRCVVGHSPPGR
jgi:hypothetical protein